MTYVSPPENNRSNASRIRIEGLNFGYKQTNIFENFNLDIDSALILLEGPSGCGKTTLLKLLAGLLTPSKAASWVRPAPTRIILQQDGLFPWLTVGGNLSCLPGWKGANSCPTAVRPLVPLVEALAQRRAYTLSFGQRRIVELFRVLYSPTPLMCLDEPFNFLDPFKRGMVADIIENLATEGICFVIASHYQEDFKGWNGNIYRFDGHLPVGRLETISKNNEATN